MLLQRRCWEAGRRGRGHTRPVGHARPHSPIHGGSVMDALLVFTLFLILALLAARFGHDSREKLASSEEAFARRGFAWHGDRPRTRST
jgi:hypothetical protein